MPRSPSEVRPSSIALMASIKPRIRKRVWSPDGDAVPLSEPLLGFPKSLGLKSKKVLF